MTRETISIIFLIVACISAAATGVFYSMAIHNIKKTLERIEKKYG